MTDQSEINDDLHARITDEAKASAQRDTDIEIKHVRLQTQLEASNENITRIEKLSHNNTEAIAALREMQRATISENKHIGQTAKDALAAAEAARDVAEDTRIHVDPLLVAHTAKLRTKEDFRKNVRRGLIGSVITAIAAGIFWVVTIVWEALHK